MRKFNLLEEIPSIRNTLRPDGSYHGMERRTSLRVCVLLGVAAGLAAAYWLGPPSWIEEWQTAPLAPIKQRTAARPAPPPSTPAVDAAVAKEPAEKKKVEEPDTAANVDLEEITTRPVAQDATPAPVKSMVKIGGGWRVRFALCLYSKSCAMMAAKLAQKDVEVQLTENPAEVTFYRVIAGPWPAVSQAQEAADMLSAKGVEAAPFLAEERYYVSAPSLTTAAGRDMVVKLCKSLWYNVEAAPPKKETRRMFKVYAKGPYADKGAAEKAARVFKGRGIECVVEKEG
ncbi:MAG: SPOR domain-containing protein [Nitrospinae bacterium]|nr:SPOR domain-containing protein [Nitrospinota bacterium]